jgi:hypothetical protein
MEKLKRTPTGDDVRIVVSRSPWPQRLPNGTELIECTPPCYGAVGNWFKRKDGKPVFPSCSPFRLMRSEYEIKTY